MKSSMDDVNQVSQNIVMVGQEDMNITNFITNTPAVGLVNI